MSANTTNAPAQTHWDGSTFAKVWRNAAKDGSPRYTSTVGYIYTDKDSGEVRESRNLRDDDLLRLPSLSQRARESIRQFRAQDRQNGQGQTQAPRSERDEFRQSRQAQPSNQQGMDRQP